MDEKKTTKGRGFSSPLMMAISLIAASVGTGNIWRFPRVMATNGGSAFVGHHAHRRHPRDDGRARHRPLHP
jgi:SNF family Na+-dependent transporter